MLHFDMIGDESYKSKSKKSSKAKADTKNKKTDKKTDATRESVLKSADKAESSKPEAIEKPIAEAAYNSSKDDDDNTGDNAGVPTVIRRINEEIAVKDIPTILMEDADDGNAIDLKPEVAVAPEFSADQIATFKEIEKEFIRERTSRYLDPNIDISILYQELHLQEFMDEELKPWNWDAIFVQVRNAITKPNISQ